jgi:hypothetical protein
MSFFSDRDWRNLLRYIRDGQVIPIVGPGLSTVDTGGGSHLPIDRAIAPQLAGALGLEPDVTRHASVNRVACEYLLCSGAARKNIYDEIRELLDQRNDEPPSALVDLASITDFNLFISSSFDPLLVKAIKKARPGFVPHRRGMGVGEANVLEYHYRKPVDVPTSLTAPVIYHVLGSYETYPDFAVWEEDYLEFICGLLQHSEQLKNLFSLLRDRYLLVIGSPATDWITRFFLRVAKGERLSDRKARAEQDYLADQPENLGESMAFFFDRIVGATRIIAGDPAAFVCELAQRWHNRQVTLDTNDPLQQMPDTMPRGAVFLSYSRDDVTAVRELVRGLRAAQVPIWIDRQRLVAGANYRRSLEFEVKHQCSFFLSVISRATESDPSRFVHTERQWAAQRHVDGYVFYIPIVIDEALPQGWKPQREPSVFSQVHFEHVPSGVVTAAFAVRLRRLMEDLEFTGRPTA